MTVPLARSFARFLVVGVLNTGLGLAVIFAAKALLGWGDVAANMFGYGVGLAVTFVLNRILVVRTPRRGAAGAGAVSRRVPAGLWRSTWRPCSCVHGSAVNSYLARAIGVVPYTLVFVAASRVLVFVSPSAGGTPTMRSMK